MAFNPEDYVYFVLIDPMRGSYSCNGYVDSEGEDRYVQDGVNKDGSVKKYRFKFSARNRKIWIHKKFKEKIEFLENHPLCQDSPNSYGKPLFKKLDEESDAKIAIDHAVKRKEASDLALSLKGNDLEEIATLIGSNASGMEMKRHHVISYAENNPMDFLSMMNDSSRVAKSIFKKALQLNVIKRKGFIFMYEDTALGHYTDEDKVISKLIKEDDLLTVIKEAIKRADKKK